MSETARELVERLHREAVARIAPVPPAPPPEPLDRCLDLPDAVPGCPVAEEWDLFRREVGRLIHGRGHKQAMAYLRKMRTWASRLVRDIGRKIEGRPDLEHACAPPLARIKRWSSQTEKLLRSAIPPPQKLPTAQKYSISPAAP